MELLSSHQTVCTLIILGSVLSWLVKVLVRAFRQDLRLLPGPVSARFSRLYRLSMVAKGHGPEEYRKLHQIYGPIVRIGPNHVSVSDPAAIPVIYGVGSKFMKVSTVYDPMLRRHNPQKKLLALIGAGWID
jgi:hypothetical protein